MRPRPLGNTATLLAITRRGAPARAYVAGAVRVACGRALPEYWLAKAWVVADSMSRHGVRHVWESAR
jgi:hypothetical protein